MKLNISELCKKMSQIYQNCNLKFLEFYAVFKLCLMIFSVIVVSKNLVKVLILFKSNGAKIDQRRM